MMKITTILYILIFLLLSYGIYDYYLEIRGSNDDKAKWCEDQGYIVENKIDFISDMTCNKLKNNVKYSYVVRESSDDIGELYYFEVT